MDILKCKSLLIFSIQHINGELAHNSSIKYKTCTFTITSFCSQMLYFIISFFVYCFKVPFQKAGILLYQTGWDEYGVSNGEKKKKKMVPAHVHHCIALTDHGVCMCIMQEKESEGDQETQRMKTKERLRSLFTKNIVA